MSAPLLIHSARVIDPATGRDERGALLVEDGIVAEVVSGEAPGTPDGATVIDAKGQVLCPGLIDCRVHTGEPGHDYRETLQSASEAAAAGGVTSMLVMPDTDPVIDDPALVDFIIRRARDTAKVRVLPAAAVTRGAKGTDLTEFGLLKEAGAVCLTEGRSAIQSSATLRAAFTYAANFGLPVAHQLADAGLVGDGVMHEGQFATVLGLKGIPVEAETVPLARDLQLAALTGVRYHAAQLSSAAAVALMARARDGADISAGVSINNLCLNENDIGAYRTFFKLSPPLRSEDDRKALVAGIAGGTIDIIHSGHDPQDVEVKRRPFAEAADGAIGLETLLAASLRLHHSDGIALTRLLATMTCNPASILGLETGRLARGAPADLILFDPDAPWVVDEASIRSRSRNTAFEGALLTGKVSHTFVGGVQVYAEAS